MEARACLRQTTAMGMGVDAPHIRVVVHVGVKELIRDYAHESGMAGGDGEASEAILMRGYHMMCGRRMLEKGFNWRGECTSISMEESAGE